MARKRWLFWLSPLVFAVAFVVGFQDAQTPLGAGTCAAAMVLACTSHLLVPSRAVRVWAIVNLVVACLLAQSVWENAVNRNPYSGYAALMLVPAAGILFLSL